MAIDQLPVDPVTVLDWADYTPTNTNVTVGNGTQTARFSRIENTVYWYYELLFGSTTTFDGTVQIGLPVTATGDGTGGSSFVSCYGDANDAGTASHVVTGFQVSGAQVRLRADGDTVVNATTPFTWTDGDILRLSGFYEAA